MNWQAAAASSITFRIGMNLGDVIAEDDDIYGDGVNVAARLEALADTGGICLSEDAWRQVRGKIKAEFEDIGSKQLKNIAEAIRVYHLGSGIRPSPDTPEEKIAATCASSSRKLPGVLLSPFLHLGSSSDAEGFVRVNRFEPGSGIP
jgi:hypothetical protein